MKKNYFFTLIFTLLLTSFSFSQVIITEIADPNGTTNARFVELYNAGDSSVDLTDWTLKRWTNANADVSSNTVDLSIITDLAAGGFVIIAASDSGFTAAYNKTADIIAGTGGPADSNGDDNIGLFNASDVLVDLFGVPGVDGNANGGTCHEFEDGRAERKATSKTAKSTWDEADWNVWADSAVSGCTSHTNSPRNVADNHFDPGTWIGAATEPTISVSTSFITGLDYFEGNGPSAEKTFTVEGLNLTEDIIITSQNAFEISLTAGGSSTNSVRITQADGIVPSTIVYVRLVKNAQVKTYSENITLTSPGVDNKTIAVSGEVKPADPQFSNSAFLNPFSYIASEGGPSAEQDFTVSGLFLTNDIIVTAPTNFEVSLTTATGFANAVTISPTSGTVETSTIYIRLKDGLPVGKSSGDITIASTGVTSETISVVGNAFGSPTNSLVITGIYDGSLTGGTPKGIELYVIEDIADLSLFGISSVTNGQGTNGSTIEFAFPADAVTSGTFIYVSTEDTNFNTFFGQNPTYTSGVVSINGDDSIELYENGQIIDVFGDVNTDGSGETWEYLDGWAYRNSNTGPEGTTFTVANWSYSGVNGLEGGTNNATATSSFPLGTYTNTTASLNNNKIEGFTTYPNPITNKEFTISSNNTNRKEVTIFNVLGKQVLKTNISGLKSIINVSSVNKGIYILKVTESGKTATKKLVIR